MTKATPTIEIYGDTVVVVARNAEEAQRAAMDTLGASCTVTAVERVRSGGVGGFFATELVRLTASRAGTAPRTGASGTAAATTAHSPLFDGSDSEMEAVLASAEDLVASLNRRTSGFAERLLDEIGATSAVSGPLDPTVDQHPHPAPTPVAQQATVTPPVAATPPAAVTTPIETRTAPPAGSRDDLLTAEDQARIAALAELLQRPEPRTPPTHVATPAVAVPAVAAPATDHWPSSAPLARSPRSAGGWSAAALRVIGVPDSIVEAMVAQAPNDDVEWLMALMGALRPLCETPRPGATLVIGPACANLARQLRFMSITAEELPETVSSVAVPHVSAKELLAGADGRSVHLVVGGSWQHLVSVPAEIVSAATDDDLMDALRAAAAWGATLGWIWSGDRYERIDPFVVASRIRDAITGTTAPRAGTVEGDRPASRHTSDPGIIDGDDPADSIPVR
jgi:hypothetical protein